MALGSLQFFIPDVQDNTTLNFEQNISVNESKAANYAKYDILARPSTIYAYLGGKARVLKLRIQMPPPEEVQLVRVCQKKEGLN
mgnify:CR=1 FL=1